MSAYFWLNGLLSFLPAATKEILGGFDMSEIWEFYENLNEIVYVADMDTHEIIYMNPKACEVFGIRDREKVKGKKCYEVLQRHSRTL